MMTRLYMNFNCIILKDEGETKKASPKNLVPILGGGFSEEAFILINGLIISSFLPDIRRIGRI